MTSEQNKQQAKFWLEYSQQLSGAIRYAEALAAVERALALDAVKRALELDPEYFDAQKRKKRLEAL